jgi:hypothetical protein
MEMERAGRGSRLAPAPGRVSAAGRGHPEVKANRREPQGSATILTIPCRTPIVGGHLVNISPHLAACVRRATGGGMLRSGEADAIVGGRSK